MVVNQAADLAVTNLRHLQSRPLDPFSTASGANPEGLRDLGGNGISHRQIRFDADAGFNRGTLVIVQMRAGRRRGPGDPTRNPVVAAFLTFGAGGASLCFVS